VRGTLAVGGSADEKKIRGRAVGMIWPAWVASVLRPKNARALPEAKGIQASHLALRLKP